MSSTHSATATPTATQTATFSHSPSITETPTISLTPTVSPTFTSSPEPTSQAAEWLQAEGKACVLAPVPARIGETIFLALDFQPQRSTWQVYNAAGQRVAALSLEPGQASGLSTHGMAPGVYVACIEAETPLGEWRKFTRKFMVVR
jgi:hypothetical protein